jgi:hypothetical protein
MQQQEKGELQQINRASLISDYEEIVNNHENINA